MGLLGKVMRKKRLTRRMPESSRKRKLGGNSRDHRPYFTYWVTSVQLFNLTENLTVWLRVETEVGTLDKMFLLTLPDPSEMAGSDLVSMTQYQITYDG